MSKLCWLDLPIARDNSQNEIFLSLNGDFLHFSASGHCQRRWTGSLFCISRDQMINESRDSVADHKGYSKSNRTQ